MTVDLWHIISWIVSAINVLPENGESPVRSMAFGERLIYDRNTSSDTAAEIVVGPPTRATPKRNTMQLPQVSDLRWKADRRTRPANVVLLVRGLALVVTLWLGSPTPSSHGQQVEAALLAAQNESAGVVTAQTSDVAAIEEAKQQTQADRPSRDGRPKSERSQKQQARKAAAKVKKQPLTFHDVDRWESVRDFAYSEDGSWVAFRVAPSEGDSKLTVKKLDTDTEHSFEVGEVQGSVQVMFSHDGKYVAFRKYPTADEAATLKKAKKPLPRKVWLVTLADGGKREFDAVGGFSFSGESSKWFAVHREAGRENGPPAPNGAAAPEKAQGRDLVLYSLEAELSLNLGNVSQFAFDKHGTWLATIIDAQDQAGNGVHLRHMDTHQVRILDSDSASYRSLNWTEEGDALCVLKGKKDPAFEDLGYSLLGFRHLDRQAPLVVELDPAALETFPDGMTISPNRTPMWTDDRSSLVFGIHEQKAKKEATVESGTKSSDKKPGNKKAQDKKAQDKKAQADKDSQGKSSVAEQSKKDERARKRSKAKQRGEDQEVTKGDEQDAGSSPSRGKRDKRKAAAARAKAAAKQAKRGTGGGEAEDSEKPADSAKKARGKEIEKPDLVIWHWKDERLQSQQQVQEAADKRFSYLAVYHVETQRFVQLADSQLKQVTFDEDDRFAIGIDNREYELSQTLDGRRYSDVYVVDPQTGSRTLALKKVRWFFGGSPDQRRLLYYRDKHFHVYDAADGKDRSITQHVAASFVDREDDHNVVDPPQRPLGWATDGESVVLSDGFDVWRVSVSGGDPGTNLTRNGKRDEIRYGRIFQFNIEQEGVDFTRPLYVSAYGEWTKKSGLAAWEPGGEGPEMLVWEDAMFQLMGQPKQASTLFYQKQSPAQSSDLYAADLSLKESRRLTHTNSHQNQFLWSSGQRLVDYTNSRGEKMQAALLLPAGYKSGQTYPTIVYIYEKLSQRLNAYQTPRTGGFSASVYNSQGYAVLMPDITYRVNDPGQSAVECILPALEAAIGTGVVDRERVALHGHSWGGYQTSFLITQTKAFKAAVAGAPLTNLISMYSSIYWNSGSANQPIFESSQGRFTSGYWDNLAAYSRNSPVYYAQQVETPLLLLHNDKDGAVDWNQGIEYYNTLRRLRKPVVMLQYKGENHGLVKPGNRLDYSIRMLEFFDHYLKGKPAPAWLEQGVPHLEHPQHIKQRTEDWQR